MLLGKKKFCAAMLMLGWGSGSVIAAPMPDAGQTYESLRPLPSLPKNRINALQLEESASFGAPVAAESEPVRARVPRQELAPAPLPTGEPVILRSEIRMDFSDTAKATPLAFADNDRGVALLVEEGSGGRGSAAASNKRIGRVVVRGIRILNAKSFSEAELLPLVDSAVGQELTVKELNSLAERITAHYRRNGFVVSRAYVPAQDVSGGVVNIAVLEGKVGAVRMANGSKMSDGVLDDYTASLQDGQPLTEAKLERPLLLMGDLPGVNVRSTLKPGSSVGASDLDVRVEAKDPVSGSVDIDNFGSRYIGQVRLGGSLDVANLAGRGDLLSLRASTSGSGMKYGRIGWQTPLGGDGLKVGVAVSDMTYRLGKDFASLNAHGSALVGTLWASYPFIRRLDTSLYGQVTYDRKRLDDKIDATSTDQRATADVLNLGLSGNHQDGFLGGGVTNFGANLIAGNIRLTPGDNSGLNTGGGYRKFSFSANRVQQLPMNFSLYGGLSGQTASKNLHSSEKLSAGGVYGVRAYAQGDTVADEVFLTSLELRWNVPSMPDLQVLGFVDAATTKIYHSPLPAMTNNTRNLSGEGLGMRWTRPGNYAIQGYLAWRNGTQPLDTSENRNPRLWLQAAKYF